MSRMQRRRPYHGKCGGERRNPRWYPEEVRTSPSRHSWRKRKTSGSRDSRWRENARNVCQEDIRNIKQWRKETVLSAERRIRELKEGQSFLKKDDKMSQSLESSRKWFPRSTETSVKESTRSQRCEGHYKDLREIIRKKRQRQENVGSNKGSGFPDVERTNFVNKHVGLKVLNEDEHHMEVTKEEEDIQPASNTVDEDELELTISEKDIFPELTDQERSKATKTHIMKTKLPSGLDNFKKVDTKGTEVDCDGSENVQCIVGNKKHIDDLNLLQVAASAPPKLERSTVSCGQRSNPDMDGVESDLATSAGSMKDRLDVELEVYTSRLRELEDERERLRVERVGLEEQERAGQKRILKLFYARDCLRDKVDLMLENENKENMG